MNLKIWFGYEHINCKYCIKKVKSHTQLLEFCGENKLKIIKTTKSFTAYNKKQAMRIAKILLDKIIIEKKEEIDN